MKTTRWSLLLSGFLSITAGCRYEEADSTPAATGLETRGEALSAPVGTWAWNAPMSSWRYAPTVTLLATGEVLVMESGSTRPERYDPYANAWRLNTSEGTSREQFTATQLPSGLVLVAGGNGPTWDASWLKTASLYDPATDTWRPTGTLNVRRGNHTATLLDSGKVLVMGGHSHPDYGAETDTAELYDPETGTWSMTGGCAPSSDHTATLLYSGKVLVTGGYNSYMAMVFPMAFIYDPATGQCSQIGDLPRPRALHLAVRLYSGNVMILGGIDDDASVDMYDPYNDRWFPGPPLPIPASYVTATMLYSGEVLVTNNKGQAALYSPATNAWLPVTNMNGVHYGHHAVLLHAGQVFIVGVSPKTERFTR